MIDFSINILHNMLEQQSQQIKDLAESNTTLASQVDQERLMLLEELEKKNALVVETIENECQTDDRQYEKLVQVNSKLKRALQGIKDKINRLATERSDLFEGIGEETNERLAHLISTIENQATKLDVQYAERNEVEKQLHNEINDLRRYLIINI